MKSILALSLLVLGLTSQACAAPATNPAYEAARKEAAARYGAEEALYRRVFFQQSDAMPARRQAQYDKALSAAKANYPTIQSLAKSCTGCGTVTSVKVADKTGEGGALGTIAGGVAGAVLGHQVGRGTGKDLATVAGAVGGAYAGHKIEGKMKSIKVWTVAVRFDNGDEKTFNFDKDPGLKAGDPIRTSNGSIQRR